MRFKQQSRIFVDFRICSLRVGIKGKVDFQRDKESRVLNVNTAPKLLISEDIFQGKARIE